jgi:hypothetical protein
VNKLVLYAMTSVNITNIIWSKVMMLFYSYKIKNVENCHTVLDVSRVVSFGERTSD